MRTIDADEMALAETEAYMRAQLKVKDQATMLVNEVVHKKIQMLIADTPTVDVVEVEKYNDLREAFVDFVCSGVHNPAPYCKNKCPECTDERGWCTYSSCTGFNPDGERK